MRSDKYWAARAAKRMDWAMLTSDEISDRIGRAYLRALRDIQSQLDSIFRNFSAGISQAEAVRILRQASIGRSSSVTDMLKQALDLISDPDDRAKLLAEINAPAYKYRMQRLKELAEDAGKKCADIARISRSELDGGLSRIVRDSYFRGVFDMQQRTGLAFSFSKVSERMIKEILQQNWSGKHYSTRIWQNTDALADELQQTLLKGVLTGASSGRMAAEIQQRFHASYTRALTLTRTESSHCANSAELYRYKDTDVGKYRYVATLDSHTSDVCRELDGREFPAEEASPGTNYPPMHPRCRSTTIEALSPELMKKLERRARDPETGELKTVPGNMTYREWYGKYVGSDFESLPGRDDSAIADLNYIFSQEFADKFKGKYENDDVERAVVSACRKLIKNRSGTFYEEAFFINAKTGKTITYIKGKHKNGIEMSEALKKRLTNAREKSIIIVHNHPNGSPLSRADYVTTSEYKSLFESVAAGHNGEVFCFRDAFGTRGAFLGYFEENGKRYPYYEAIRDYRVSYSKHILRGDSDFDARNHAWQEISKMRGFTYEKR